MLKNYKTHRPVLLFILIAVLSALIFRQLTMCVSTDGKYATPNNDTYVYMQYAQSIAQGHPYQFHKNDTPTTGCTSHLYPFVLSLFYLSGAHGQALVECAFWFNVFLFVISIALLWFMLGKLEPKGHIYIMTYFILCGQVTTIFTTLSDMGLFIAFTFAFWNSILYHRHKTAAGILLLLPFVRPEGIFFTVIFLALLLWEYVNTGTLSDKKQRLTIAAGGIVGSGGMLLLNLLLTGIIGMDSTQGKSYLSQMQLLSALSYTHSDLIALWKTFFWGMGQSFRQYFFIPFISAACILFGFITFVQQHHTDSTSRFVTKWWLGCLVTTVLMVAASGQNGLHFDRYFFWFIPLLIIFLIHGVLSLPVNRVVQAGIIIVMLLFQTGSYLYFLRDFIMSSTFTNATIRNYRKACEMFPEKMTVGVFGASGIQYLNPKWKVINIGGVTAPWFRGTGANLSQKIKICQHNPALQFNKFIKLPEIDVSLKHVLTDSTVIDLPSPFKTAMTFYSVDWSLLTIGASPVSDTIEGICLKTLRMVDQFDAALPADENRCAFEARSRFPYTKEQPVLTKGRIHTTVLVDAVRPATRGAYVTLATRPGKKHYLVLRTAIDESVLISDLKGVRYRRINTRNVDHLLLKIPGRFKTKIAMSDTSDSNDHYRERIVSIPPEAITGSKTEFGILGDHLLCDVWLYTASENYSE